MSAHEPTAVQPISLFSVQSAHSVIAILRCSSYPKDIEFCNTGYFLSSSCVLSKSKMQSELLVRPAVNSLVGDWSVYPWLHVVIAAHVFAEDDWSWYVPCSQSTHIVLEFSRSGNINAFCPGAHVVFAETKLSTVKEVGIDGTHFAESM